MHHAGSAAIVSREASRSSCNHEPSRRRYVTADVFTDRMFHGNPLAVVLDAEGLTAAQMQAIAREFNYIESTFVLPPDDPAHTARVRIFTPACCMDPERGRIRPPPFEVRRCGRSSGVQAPPCS